MAEAPRFWAAAYFAPLHVTLGQWHEACAAPERFVQAWRAWWPVLADGTQALPAEAAVARTARPRCVPPWGEETWLVQRAVLLYVCHAPYCTPDVPVYAQPFRPLVETYAACLSRNDAPRTMHAWLSLSPPRERAFLQAVVRALLAGQCSDVSDLVPCDVCATWAVPTYVPRATPLAACEASRAAGLLEHNESRPLDLVRQAWLQQYWRRMRHDMHAGSAESIELMAGLAIREAPMHGVHMRPTLVVSLAQQHAGLAAEWVLCTCCLPPTHVPPAWVQRGLWEQLGEAFAQATSHLRAAGDVLVLLLESSERVSTTWEDGTTVDVRLAWLVQRICVPRFLAALATVMESAWREDVAEFVCTWTLRLLHKPYLPLHRDARPKEPEDVHSSEAALTALYAHADDELDMLDAVLRSATLRYARHAYAAALYQALTHGPRPAT